MCASGHAARSTPPMRGCSPPRSQQTSTATPRAAVARTTVLRVVEGHAAKAQKFVHERLVKARKQCDEPLATRPGVDRMIVELDGCDIRTGTLRPLGTEEKSLVRELPKRVRETAWVDTSRGTTSTSASSRSLRCRMRARALVAHEGVNAA